MTKITPIPGPVFDPLSIAYFFRLHPLVPGGKPHFLPVMAKNLEK